jgi:hypothetical protein
VLLDSVGFYGPQQDHKLHNVLMTLAYNYVHTEKIWHILRLYHRVVVWSADSEALAEHVGSVIRYIEKKHSTGRPLETSSLVKVTTSFCAFGFCVSWMYAVVIPLSICMGICIRVRSIIVIVGAIRFSIIIIIGTSLSVCWPPPSLCCV